MPDDLAKKLVDAAELKLAVPREDVRRAVAAVLRALVCDADTWDWAFGAVDDEHQVRQGLTDLAYQVEDMERGWPGCRWRP
jgi:hypothetical protein